MELAVASIPEQKPWLCERLTDFRRVHARRNMPVGDEDVWPAIEVEVKELGSPA